MGLAQSRVSGLTGLCAIGCVSLQGAFPIHQGLSQNLARAGGVACLAFSPVLDGKAWGAGRRTGPSLHREPLCEPLLA